MNDINQELTAQYRRDGFCVLPRLLPAELIDAHLCDCARVLAEARLTEKPGPGDNRHTQALLALNQDNRPCGHLQFHPALIDFVAALLDEPEPIMAGGNTSWWEKGREPHADTMMLLRDPPDHVCRTWCALEDIHPDCGMFYVIPGSQRNIRPGLYQAALAHDPDMREVLTSPNVDEFAANRRMWRVICEVTAERVAGMTRHPFPLRKGDVVVFDPNAVHGTMPVLKPALTRKAMILEWHARDVRTYPVSAYFGPEHDRRRPDNGRLTAGRARRGALGWRAHD